MLLVCTTGCLDEECPVLEVAITMDIDGDAVTALHITAPPEAEHPAGYTIDYQGEVRNSSPEPCRFVLYLVPAAATPTSRPPIAFDEPAPHIHGVELVSDVILPGRTDETTWVHPFPDAGWVDFTAIVHDGPLDARFIVLTSADPKLEVRFDFSESHQHSYPPCDPPAAYTVETY